jgi:phospholipid/cholesterol/gamma-HCH transport system substrate-binding protein
MRRMIAIALVLIAVPVLLVFAIGAGGSGGGSTYKVRAIFDFVRAVPGEDVKIAGAKVGKIGSLDVTPDNKAAVVLDIQKSGFTPFHTDAHCTIRPQSLIGENFADCSPGSTKAPDLPRIKDGQPGAGQYLLPVQNTSSPVDIDEINDIYRLPIRQRLAVIINEFGTGLAGRGANLNDVIHRANPALRDTDKVLAILARQNRTLANLAKNSDQVLAPLAAKREQFADFFVQANKTNQATDERIGDLKASIERFPAFLKQLQPTLEDLSALADQMTPVISDLGQAAPGINRFIEQLGPFSNASIPALKSLGNAADVGRTALIASRPISNDLRQFATNADPVSADLEKLTTSLSKTGAVNYLMDYILNSMTAINGFDGVSHYLRAALIVNTCATYGTVPDPACLATFPKAGRSTAATSAADQEIQSELEKARSAKPKQPSLLSRILSIAAEPANQGKDAQPGVRRIQQNAAGDSSQAFGPSDPALKYLLGN